MDFLARREHSQVELRRKLATRGFDAELIETTLADLVAENLLSNSRFAEAFVHSRFQKGSGPQKIHAELRERGIDDGLIDASIAGYDQQWLERVREVREKKFGAHLPGDYSAFCSSAVLPPNRSRALLKRHSHSNRGYDPLTRPFWHL